ncbi:hypothetical protein JX266_007480 [Neoarthrinium moseri]|nr:hypothetical protein JX266_007480 [Neoarthrinium moseri]
MRINVSKSAVLAGLILACPVRSTITFETILEATRDITAITTTVDGLVEDPSITNFIKAVPSLVSETVQLATDIAHDLFSDNSVPLNQTEQLDACSTFKDFATAEFDLITTIAEKVAVLATSWIPFASILQGLFHDLEQVIDAAAAMLIKVAPVCSSETKDLQASLDTSFQKIYDSLA